MANVTTQFEAEASTSRWSYADSSAGGMECRFPLGPLRAKEAESVIFAARIDTSLGYQEYWTLLAKSQASVIGRNSNNEVKKQGA